MAIGDWASACYDSRGEPAPELRLANETRLEIYKSFVVIDRDHWGDCWLQEGRLWISGDEIVVVGRGDPERVYLFVDRDTANPEDRFFAGIGCYGSTVAGEWTGIPLEVQWEFLDWLSDRCGDSPAACRWFTIVKQRCAAARREERGEEER